MSVKSRRARYRFHLMSRKASDTYSLPVDGLPLDLVVAIKRSAPEAVVEVCALIEEIRGESPRGVFSYQPADIERIWARLEEVCRARK